jgi:hypothetical protein
MSDVYISHALEDRTACERLGAALRGVGVSVVWNESSAAETRHAVQADTAVQDACTTIVLWSRHAIGAKCVNEEARLALELKPKSASSISNRYLGLIADATLPETLPNPYNGLATAHWAEWFSAPLPAHDDAVFISLLTTLELMSGNKSFVATARELAIRDAEAARLRLQVRAKDEALSSAQASASQAESALNEKIEALNHSLRDLQVKDSHIESLERTLEALQAERGSLQSALEERNAALEGAQKRCDVLSASLADANKMLANAQDAKKLLESNLEDARLGLAGALRQHDHLNALLKASDMNLGTVLGEREALKNSLQQAEHKLTRLIVQLNDTQRKLGKSEETRQTYESALVDRKKEIDQANDKAAAAITESNQLAGRVVQLDQSVKSWGHVPWRGIAAGSLAAGSAVTYLAVLAAGFFVVPTPDGAVAIASPPVNASGYNPATPLVETEGAGPKSDAKLEPDSLQVVESGPALDDRAGTSDLSETGVIAIPDESAAPPPNNQVEFNPEGLPPVDPEQRPPPQDLPPMQQKPRLMLKPSVPQPSMPER